MKTKTQFYRYNLNGVLYGLVRRRTTGGGGWIFAYVGNDNQWVRDGSILRKFLNGDAYVDYVEIAEAEAQQVADEYGVTLDGEPVRETALNDRPGID